jgi:prefoldin subunit 5
MSNKDKLASLYKELEDVISKRESLQSDINDMTALALKLQGAIEVLEELEKESETKEEK